MRIIASSVFLPLLFTAVLGSAQQPAASAPAGSDAIRLNVAVTDGSGKLVHGLSQADFTLLSNKTPLQIDSFKELDSKSDPVEVLLVIDAVNTPYSALQYQREQITKYLHSREGALEHPTSFAILTDKGVSVSGDPTTNGNTLSDALANNETGLRIIGRSEGFYGAEDRASISLAALRQILDKEAKLPGRKLILWISPGWPLLSGPQVELAPKQQQGLFQDAVALSTQIRKAQITLFNVNSWGPGESLGRELYYQSFLDGVKKAGGMSLANLSLQVLAIQSGGLVTNSSDVVATLQRDASDADDDYEIAFHPAAAEHADEYHPLQIHLSEPALKARSTQGYYAQP